MNNKEFRLGNYIYGVEEGYKETAMEISSLHSDGTFRLKIGKDSVGCYHGNSAVSIPLTEEWLIKFGFLKHKNWDMGADSYDLSYKDIYFSHAIRLAKISFKQNLLSNDWISLPNYKHVHQLQNLYWCLVGTELLTKQC